MRPLSEIKNDRTLAHVLPLALFMIITLPWQFAGDWFNLEWKHPLAPWWRHYPEHWLYPIQSLICIVLLLFFRKNYEWKISGKAALVGMVAGTIGIGFWILPTHLHMVLDYEGEQEGWLKWLGVMPRDDGFNPQDLVDKVGGGAGLYWSTLLMRFLRAVVVVGPCGGDFLARLPDAFPAGSGPQLLEGAIR